MSDIGKTEKAGDGVGDEQFADQVAEQTSSDLQAKDVFERDAGGTTDPTEAAEESADEVRG